jgi:hypothetical protein
MKNLLSSAQSVRSHVRTFACLAGAAVVLAGGTGNGTAKPNPAQAIAPLNAAGGKLEAKFAATLAELRAEILKALPGADPGKQAAFQAAIEKSAQAAAAADAAQQELGKVNTAKALVDHAKGKWIGGAEKGIAQAEAALKKATTAAEREAAEADLAKWRANKEDGLKALQERQVAHEQAKVEEPRLKAAHEAAQAALAQARADELSMAKALLAAVDPVLSSDRLDAQLATCTVVTEATPRGLAEFAQQGQAQAALVEKLLADARLMKVRARIPSLSN